MLLQMTGGCPAVSESAVTGGGGRREGCWSDNTSALAWRGVVETKGGVTEREYFHGVNTESVFVFSRTSEVVSRAKGDGGGGKQAAPHTSTTIFLCISRPPTTCRKKKGAGQQALISPGISLRFLQICDIRQPKDWLKLFLNAAPSSCLDFQNHVYLLLFFGFSKYYCRCHH